MWRITWHKYSYYRCNSSIAIGISFVYLVYPTKKNRWLNLHCFIIRPPFEGFFLTVVTSGRFRVRLPLGKPGKILKQILTNQKCLKSTLICCAIYVPNTANTNLPTFWFGLSFFGNLALEFSPTSSLDAIQEPHTFPREAPSQTHRSSIYKV